MTRPRDYQDEEQSDKRVLAAFERENHMSVPPGTDFLRHTRHMVIVRRCMDAGY